MTDRPERGGNSTPNGKLPDWLQDRNPRPPGLLPDLMAATAANRVEMIMSDRRAGTILLKMREASPDKGATAYRILNLVESAVYLLQRRVSRDPEIVELMESFVRNLENAAWFGRSDQPLSEGHAREIKETLQRAVETVDPNTPSRG